MDALEFGEDGFEEILSSVGLEFLDFDRHLFNPQNIFSKPRDFVGVKHQHFIGVAPHFRVQALGIVGRIQQVGMGVGIAVNRGAGAIESRLHSVNAHQATDGIRVSFGFSDRHIFNSYT